ncbi:MAG: hypothetical protein JRF47_18525, partial [Deltaproteobacteria bacterium]|nr:hypothetical protein [Deltaproteobacteria bacterium]
MRKFYRFILVRQCLDGDRLRYIFITVSLANGIPVIQSLGGHHFLFILWHRADDLGFWNHVAVQAGSCSLLAFFLKRCMAADTALFGLFGFVTTGTALIDIQAVHGLLEGDTAAIFFSL